MELNGPGFESHCCNLLTNVIQQTSPSLVLHLCNRDNINLAFRIVRSKGNHKNNDSNNYLWSPYYMFS